MTPVRVSTGASDRLDEIYDHTRRTWGEAQADACIRGLFGKFKAIAARTFPWHPIPAEFGVDANPKLCRQQLPKRIDLGIPYRMDVRCRRRVCGGFELDDEG